MKTLRICLLFAFLILFSFNPQATSASTLTSSGGNIPWGARNPYWANDGSGNFDSAYFDVGFPNFDILGSGVDIYTGTGGTAASGPGSYPNDPAAYFNGFPYGQPITFTVTLTNNTGTRGADTVWFSASKVDSCPGFIIDTDVLTEKDLSDCSNASIVNGIMTNQTNLLNTWGSRTYETIDPGQSRTLTYTWAPPEPGYYQFDFGSDDYADISNCLVNGLYNGTDCTGTGIPPSNTYAAGFIKVLPGLSCSISGPAQVSKGSSATIYTATTTDSRVRTIEVYNNYIDTAQGQYYNKLATCHSFPCNASLNASAIPASYNNVWVLCNAYVSPSDDPLNLGPAIGWDTACTGNPSATLPAQWASCGSTSHTNVALVSTPTITSLQITNGGNPLGGTAVKTSGLAQGEGGQDWYNPMAIQLNASPGNAGNIALYATAFYDKNQSLSSVQPALNSLSAIEGQIDTDATRGFLLVYAAQDCANQPGNCQIDNKGTGFSANKYYVYVKSLGWIDISGKSLSNPYPVKNSSNQTIYGVYPISNGSYFASWGVKMFSLFGSKSMYTPGFVIDSNNLTGFQNDL